MLKPCEDKLKRRYFSRMCEELEGLRAASGPTSDDRKLVALDHTVCDKATKTDDAEGEAGIPAEDRDINMIPEDPFR